jgi:hypothetical protein
MVFYLFTLTFFLSTIVIPILILFLLLFWSLYDLDEHLLQVR